MEQMILLGNIFLDDSKSSSYEIGTVFKHVVTKTAYQSLMSMYISHCTIVLLKIDQKGSYLFKIGISEIIFPQGM